jgi:hypothetical protein
MRASYSQSIAKNGYQITNGFLEPRPMFCFGHEINIGKDSRTQALFRKFAKIKTDADVLAFANTYGPLGFIVVRGVYVVDFRLKGVPIKNRKTAFSEPVNEWKRQAKEMRFLLTLYEAKTNREIKAAFAAYEKKQNDSPLIEECKPFVASFVSAFSQGGIIPHFSIDKRGKWQMQLGAVDLLAVMWNQFALLLADGLDLAECENNSCPYTGYFLTGPGAKRRSALYCTDECKNAVHNAKRPSTRKGRVVVKKKGPGSKG